MAKVQTTGDRSSWVRSTTKRSTPKDFGIKLVQDGNTVTKRMANLIHLDFCASDNCWQLSQAW